MRVTVSLVACRTCNRVLSVTAPRQVTDAEWDATPEDDREIDAGPTPCSPAFAGWAWCPEHPDPGPDQGLRYSKDALPLLWATRVLHVPTDQEADQ